jgi:hypothetical protein
MSAVRISPSSEATEEEEEEEARAWYGEGKVELRLLLEWWW